MGGTNKIREKITLKKSSKKKLVVTSADEVYTQAHVDSLGTHSTPWELFVDGYDLESGRRIYDTVRGATCHQCRQKTLGTHTSCDRCGRLSGIYCGDCLFMRYGENVREANEAREAARERREAAARERREAAAKAGAASGSSRSGSTEGENEDDDGAGDHGWVCPPCRGLCNCSFHRARRGWAPTGSLYRYALAEGYASVAHFLVLTNLGEGVVVPPGLRQGKRKRNGAAAASSSRPATAAAATVGVVPDPPVTTTVARGGKPRSKSGLKSPTPPQAPGSPLPSAKRAKAATALRRSLSSPKQQLSSPTLEPAPVAAAASLLPNGKRRTGSFMSQLRLNPEALKKRGAGGGGGATKKREASAAAAKGKATKKKPAAVKKAAISVSPRAPRASRRSARGAVAAIVAVAAAG